MPDQKEKNRKLNAELSRALMNDVERLELSFATYWRQIAAVAVVAAIVVALVFWMSLSWAMPEHLRNK